VRSTLRTGLLASLAAVITAGTVTAAAAPATAGLGANARSQGRNYTFAVIGDIPYGDQQIGAFPRIVDQINADPSVRWVDHLGDIKSGSSVCSDGYFSIIRNQFDRFVDPLVYTIGDNEWTDCHRPNNGAYNPLERLAAVRRAFFPQPGRTLGQHPATVLAQTDQGLPENVRWQRAEVSFAALHIVGSNNGLSPWTGNTAPTAEQTSEVLARTSGTIQEIHDAFATGRREHDRAVVLLTQADMFDPTVTAPTFADYYAYQPIVRAIAREAAAYRGPVYLFNGDSHVYNSDSPLGAGSPWLAFYGVGGPVPNLSRITVDGSTGVNDYLRVTVHDHGRQVLSWERVPFTT